MVHKHVGANIPLHSCFHQYSCCPYGIITSLSFEMLRVYNKIGGIKVNTPKDYYNLPALYVEAVEVIETEVQRIKKFKHG